MIQRSTVARLIEIRHAAGGVVVVQAWGEVTLHIRQNRRVMSLILCRYRRVF